MIEAPAHSHGRGARPLYRVRREGETSTYTVERIERQTVTVDKHEGWFVRYSRSLYSLHDAQGLPVLIQKIISDGGRVHYINNKNKPFEPTEQDLLPYFLEWECIGTYRF